MPDVSAKSAASTPKKEMSDADSQESPIVLESVMGVEKIWWRKSPTPDLTERQVEDAFTAMDDPKSEDDC